jgi:hypothetical protein
MDWYFLFSPDNMPLGVFRTETPEESQKLFCKLYRRSWDEMTKLGIYMKKEQDVPASMWDEIHVKYEKRKKKELPPPVIAPVLPLNKLRNDFILHRDPTATVQLESEKYLRMHLRH